MSKTFGYTKTSGKDWYSCDPYDDAEIEAIKDPEGGSEISLPTAIPSPFARIDLVKTAFNNIIKSPDLKKSNVDGCVVVSKDDERLVSECLDLAEMLFNFDNVKDKIKIIIWDRKIELEKLKNAADEHRRFAETLEIYLTEDREAYNFDLMSRLYLIEYDYKIIGCTSPATLFFATANDLSFAQMKLTTNDVIFGEKYVPLYERDADFQKYFHLLFKANAILGKKMKGLANYLELSLKKLGKVNPALYNELNKLDKDSYVSNYTELDDGTSGNVIEVLGVPLMKRKQEDIHSVVETSEFIIRSSRYKGKMPLALQNGLNKPFKYVNGKWDSRIAVPYVDKEPMLERRWLPGVKIQYPYLTVSDLLEPYLIRLIYPVNKEKFFDGNVIPEVGDDSKGFVLPLKKQFFDYFTSEDLLSTGQGKPQIKMVQGAAGSVKVTLKVPVAKEGEFIAFERIYYQSAENGVGKPEEEQNKGVILEHKFGLTIFPFIKTNDPEIKAYYRIQLVDRDISGVLKDIDYDLRFLSDASSNLVPVRAKKTRSIKKTGDNISAASQYYVLQNEFDVIQIHSQKALGATGVLIPKWNKYEAGNKVFSFAIDFGTTNTHIEYKIDGGSPHPFDITAEDIQIATLFDPKRLDTIRNVAADDIYMLVEHEFLPDLIGKKCDYHFPIRTVLAESTVLNIETETFTLADFNIPFGYERRIVKDKITSNLKWAKKEKGNEKRVGAYFEKIMMLLRNKVLLNGGDLSETRLIWFYPSSMNPARKASLEKAWHELYKTYFHPNEGKEDEKQVYKPIGITESIAPFYYFKGANRLQGGSYKPVVSVDIGGGTTDIVVFKSNKPLLLSSFKFGANTIFGDGFSEYGAAGSNGFINKYHEYFEDLCKINKLYDLMDASNSIKEKNKTEDINAFIFSIENNPKVKDKKLFSYNGLLSNDEDLKIIFLYYFSAIIYHVADLMNTRKIELPKHIIFSGTGSKILNIISSDLKIVSGLAKTIFEGVYKTKFDKDGLTIETEKEMPKEVTCKGGLMYKAEDLELDIPAIREILTCVESKGINKLSYNDLTDVTKADIVNYVSEFNDFFIKLNAQYNFASYFNVSEKAFNIFKAEVNKHLRDYLEEGLDYNQHLDDVSADQREIEETLFFYPLIGTINNLSAHLATLTPINN